MPCIEPAAQSSRLAAGWLSALSPMALAVLLALSGCSQPPATPQVPEAQPASPGAGTAPARPGAPAVPSGSAKAPAPRRNAPVRSWDDWRRQAAQQLVAANAERTYDGVPPEPLLAIPVLEVELNGDGSVRRVGVLRRPTQAQDTVQLAIAAVHRAAPFAPVSHLPRPWKYTETFLFSDDRRFKPRTLDD